MTTTIRSTRLMRRLFSSLEIGALSAAVMLAGCNRSDSSSRQAGGRRGGGAPTGAVPVVAGLVQQRDTPIYLDGIGTVTAFNAVTMHPQVQGQLESLAFNEGQDVKVGDLLAVIDPRPFQAALDQAKGKLAQDQAQLANARTIYERYSGLLTKGLIDPQTVDTDKASFDQAQAQVKADEAAVSAAQVQLDYTHIASPINGRTGLRQVDPGNVVRTTDTNGLVVITQLQPISVVFTLPQQTLARIHEATDAGDALHVVAIDRDSRSPLGEGTLAVVDNQIDTTTGTIKLKATFPNEKRALWPGQFVNVRLLVETRKNGVTVPASVVQRGPQGTYAFVIDSNSAAQIRPLKVAQIDGDTALIDDGLKAGERVVVDGQYKLQVGSTVSFATDKTATNDQAPDSSSAHQRRQKTS